MGIAANGRAYYRITVRGITAHTGNNHLGINAAVKATKLIERIQELREDVNNRRFIYKAGDLEINGKARLSINQVEAVTIGNNVPDKCIILVDRRLIPQRETFESGQAELQAIIDDLKEKDPDFDAEIEFVPDRWMNFAVSVPDSPIVKVLTKAVEKVKGWTPTIPTVQEGGGSSDHGWFKLKYPDRPHVSFGMANGSAAHGYDEYATIDGLIDNSKVYAIVFMDLLGVA
jgi:acetylornithine deacetylase